MFMRSSKKVADDSPAGAPAWMTTFSDCMTLLLTFFVLLLSFSSFDEISLKPLFGVLRSRPIPSILENERTVDDTVVKDPASVVDRTDKGAEKRTSDSLDRVRNPKAPTPIVETDAYHDERIFSIPTGQLFLGNGNILTGWGQEYLKKMSLFMKLVPCRVVVGQVNSSRSQPPAAGADRVDSGLTRSCVVVRFLTQQQGVPAGQFCLSPTRPARPGRFRSESVVQIRLLAKDVTQ